MPLSMELKKSLETGWFWPICQSYAKEHHISQDDMTVLAIMIATFALVYGGFN
jgi:hypothetical protein